MERPRAIPTSAYRVVDGRPSVHGEAQGPLPYAEVVLGSLGGVDPLTGTVVTFRAR